MRRPRCGPGLPGPAWWRRKPMRGWSWRSLVWPPGEWGRHSWGKAAPSGRLGGYPGCVGGIDRAAASAAIGAFPIDGAGRGQDQFFDLVVVVGQDIEQEGSTQDIGAGIVANPVHGLACSCLRGQMDHRSDIAQGRNPVPAAADIATNHLHVGSPSRVPSSGLRDRTVDLRAQIVQEAYRHAASDQRARERQPDEPEPPGNQDLFAHLPILTCLLSIAPVSIRLVV